MSSLRIVSVVIALVGVFSICHRTAEGQTRLRGVMVASACDSEFLASTSGNEGIERCAARLNRDIEELATWNVNVIRFQLVTNVSAYYSLNGYQSWINWELAVLDKIQPSCAAHRINIIVDLHRAPSVLENGIPQSQLFTSRDAQSLVRTVWKQIATHYKNVPRIYAYDLVNEPNDRVVGAGLMTWPALAQRLVSDIRKIDTRPYVMIETRDGRARYINSVPIINDARVIYSVHHYDPVDFTQPDHPNAAYPGSIGGSYWDKNRLKTVLQPVKDFAARTGAKILIGEFSAARYYCHCDAAGCHDDSGNSCTTEQALRRIGSSSNYLRDSIELFEDRDGGFGFDWVYHAFREAEVWNVELGTDPVSARSANLLRAYFGRN